MRPSGVLRKVPGLSPMKSTLILFAALWASLAYPLGKGCFASTSAQEARDDASTAVRCRTSPRPRGRLACWLALRFFLVTTGSAQRVGNASTAPDNVGR